MILNPLPFCCGPSVKGKRMENHEVGGLPNMADVVCFTEGQEWRWVWREGVRCGEEMRVGWRGGLLLYE